MIYALHALGTGYLKIGCAQSVGQRLAELQTASPHELVVIATAPAWPDTTERALHLYLEPCRVRREWFAQGPLADTALAWLNDRAGGLFAFQVICARLSIELTWLPVCAIKKKPRRRGPMSYSVKKRLRTIREAWRSRPVPSLPPFVLSTEALARYEEIKQRRLRALASTDDLQAGASGEAVRVRLVQRHGA
jgi:hypothetical protein